MTSQNALSTSSQRSSLICLSPARLVSRESASRINSQAFASHYPSNEPLLGAYRETHTFAFELCLHGDKLCCLGLGRKCQTQSFSSASQKKNSPQLSSSPPLLLSTSSTNKRILRYLLTVLQPLCPAIYLFSVSSQLSCFHRLPRSNLPSVSSSCSLPLFFSLSLSLSPSLSLPSPLSLSLSLSPSSFSKQCVPIKGHQR